MSWKKWRSLMCENKIYLIVSIVGLILLAVGGVYYLEPIGKVLFFVGLVFSILSIILGLRNKSLEWEEL